MFPTQPYNPVLGEVYRCGFAHEDKSHGVSYLTAEQVSHHPPITAINLSNPTIGFELNSSNKPEPKFYGNHIDIKMNGIVRIYLHDSDEEYHLSRPNILTSGILGIGSKARFYSNNVSARGGVARATSETPVLIAD